MKSPQRYLHARTISWNRTLPRYHTGQLMWTRRTAQSTRNLNRLLVCRQVCLPSLEPQPFHRLVKIPIDLIFFYSWRQRLWRPDVWPEGSSTLWLRRRSDTLLFLHFYDICLSSFIICEDKFFPFPQRLMMRSPSTRMTSSPTSRWLTRAGGRDSVTGAWVSSRHLMFSWCSERQAQGVFEQAWLLYNLRFHRFFNKRTWS